MRSIRKSVLLGLAAIACSSVPASAVGEPPFTPPLTWRQPLEQGSTLRGIITNIDPVNQTLFLKDSTGIVRAIALDNEVQIEKRDRSATLRTISIGDDVTLRK